MCLRCDGFTRDECCGRRHHTRWPASWQKDKGKRVATKQGHYVKWKELRCNCSCHLGLFCDLFVARLAALQRVVRRNKCINEAVGDKFCLRRRVDFFLRRKSFSDTFLCTCARALAKTPGWYDGCVSKFEATKHHPGAVTNLSLLPSFNYTRHYYTIKTHNDC